MEIHYSSERLERFLSPDKIIKNLGRDIARMYYTRYDALVAAPTFAMYLKTALGHPERLRGSEDYSIRLTGNYRLIVRPEGESLSIVELQECTTVEVKGVVDYHGSKETWKTP